MGIPGPEDFEVDTHFGKRLIISSQERRDRDEKGEMKFQGNIFSLQPSSGHIEKFEIKGRDDYPFHPHGISYIYANGSGYLYVINHALTTQHSIEKFRVSKNELYFVERYRNDLFIHPNDLVVSKEGILYITNDHEYTGFAGLIGDVFGFGWSNVVYFHTRPETLLEDEERFGVAVDGIGFANGIALDDNRLYVAGLRDEAIHVFSRDKNSGKVLTKISEIEIGSGVDNLMWERSGVLNVAAHPDLYAFLDHVQSDQNHSPSEVYRVILNRYGEHKVERIFADDGKIIDAASTGMVINNQLFISGVFDNEIVACPL